MRISVSNQRLKTAGAMALLVVTCVGGPSLAVAKGRAKQPAPAEAGAPAQVAGSPAEINSRQNPAPAPAPAPTQDANTPVSQLTASSPIFTFTDVPDTRTGVDPSNVLQLTMLDAIARSVRQNNDIEVSRFDVKTAEYDVFGAKGAYNPKIGAEFSFQSATFPITNVFGGGGLALSANQKDLVFNGSYDQLLKSGATINAFFNNDRQTTDATNQTLNPQYQPRLGVEFAQPLLRNFEFDATRRNIELAKRQFDLSDAQFRQKVIDIISQTQRAYWDLVYALRNEQIQRESVQLARVQLENNLKQVEAGTLAPIELRSTESDLEARKEGVITALQQITVAENALKNLMITDPNDPLWSARIIPLDPAGLVPSGIDLDTALKSAILNRPELEQMKLRTNLKEIDSKYFKNQLKPQLDMFASYSLQGVAGTPAPILGSGTPTVFVPDRFIGGYGRALGTLFSNDFNTYQVGLRFSFPIGNDVAEANYGRTQAELRQLDAEQRRLIQSIQVEVRNALQAVDAARQRFEAAKASRVAAEAQLQGEEERFRAGLSTNFFVLDRQNQLSEARGREAQALTDYNKAIVDLQRVTGTTMAVNNVTISAKDS